MRIAEMRDHDCKFVLPKFFKCRVWVAFTSTTMAPTRNAKSPEPVEEEWGGIEAHNSDSDSGHLYGFSSDDSSDEDDLTGPGPVDIDVAGLPTIAKDDATVKRKLEKVKRQPVSMHLVLVILY
jgi:nucleolar protein 15